MEPEGIFRVKHILRMVRARDREDFKGARENL
jgi:hypothetical protein